MARKKKKTYNDIMKMMETIQKKASEEKGRMAEVLVSELDYITALRLGDLSESELRRVARFMYDHIGVFVNLAKLDMTKAQQLQAADGPMAEGEVKYNYSENCWEILDTATGERIGTLRRGMRVELQAPCGEDWVPVEAEVSVMDVWRLTEKNEGGRSIGIFGGLQVRFHKV